MFLRSIHGLVCINLLFLFYCQVVSHCMDITQFDLPTALLMEYLLVTIYGYDKAAMNIWVQIFLLSSIFISLRKYLGAELLSYVISVYLTF